MEGIEKRKKKIIEWFKNPHNFTLSLIVLFAIILRIFYFSLTKNQPLWWDEAVYMNMARAFAFGIDHQFSYVRPILFSLISAGFLRISPGEFLPRLLLFVFSITSIIGMYFLGKEIYNKYVGLISAFLMAVFYLNLFQTFRILIDLPSTVFFIFSAIYFYRYLKTEDKKAIYIAIVIAGIGTLFRITTALILFIFIILLFITKGFKILKKKELWISAALFWVILSPYIIWGYIKFKGFIITLAGSVNAPTENYATIIIGNLKAYLLMLPQSLHLPLFLLFLLGLFLTYKLFIGFDLLFKKGNWEIKRDFYLILMLIIPIIFSSIFQANAAQPRYIFGSFVVIFLLASHFIFKLYNLIKTKSKTLAILIVIILLGSIAFLQIQHADDIIRLRKDSYMQVKEAGEWLKQNTGSTDIIFTLSGPQTEFYSERKILMFPNTKEELESLLESNKNIKYYELSIFEKHLDWVQKYPTEKNLTPVYVGFEDREEQKPILIIYSLND